MAHRPAAIAWSCDGWSAQLLSVPPRSWEQTSEWLKSSLSSWKGPGRNIPLQRKGPNKGCIVWKVQFHQAPSCCPVSVSLIYGLFAVKSVCRRLLPTPEGLCDHVPFKHTPEPWDVATWTQRASCVTHPKHNKLCLLCSKGACRRSGSAAAGTRSTSTPTLCSMQACACTRRGCKSWLLSVKRWWIIPPHSCMISPSLPKSGRRLAWGFLACVRKSTQPNTVSCRGLLHVPPLLLSLVPRSSPQGTEFKMCMNAVSALASPSSYEGIQNNPSCKRNQVCWEVTPIKTERRERAGKKMEPASSVESNNSRGHSLGLHYLNCTRAARGRLCWAANRQGFRVICWHRR